MSLWSRITNVLRADRLTLDLDEELQSHIAEAIEQGRDPAEARRAFGSTLHQREASRDIRLLPWLDSLRADAIFGWRQLMKKKATSAAAVLSLALAIGACTSAFRLIDALFLRPLPIAHPERLHVIAFEGPGMDRRIGSWDSCSYPMFVRMRDALKDQAELIAISYADRLDLTYGPDQDTEKAYWQYVSGSMFRSFGLRPALGRLFTESDDLKPGAHPYAVLSHEYWTHRFGQDRRVVGRAFRMGGVIYEIVGVAEERFTGTETGVMTDIFVPMMMKNPVTLASPTNFWLRTLVLLKPDVAPAPVHARLLAIYRAMQQEQTKEIADSWQLRTALQQELVLDPAPAGRSNMQRDYRRSLATLGVLVMLVLLIACANVANLMTARAASRAREMALRVSIGAGRWRLVQLVLVESAWLAFLATAVGALFAWWSAPFIVGMINPPDNPARFVLPADYRVVAFGLGLASCVTFLFGLAPALRASAVQPVSALRGGSDPHSRRRLMRALIAVQVAFCFVVHFVSGLFVTTFERLANQPTGFSSERILNLQTVTLRPQSPVFWDQVTEHLRSLPGVETIALTVWPLMIGESRVSSIAIDGARSSVLSDVLFVSPGWLGVMRIPFIAGRDFRADDQYPAVAIVNEAFAKQYFNGENPVGRTFEITDKPAPHPRLQIAGWVRDARSRDNMRAPIRATAYVPFHAVDAQGAPQAMGRGTFVVRTWSSHPLAVASILRLEVPRVLPGFRVTNIRTQTELVESTMLRERLLATLAVFFAGVALLLAGIGLYGVLDYGVLQQRREIGIRMALGAQAGSVARRVTADAFSMVLAGAVAGVALGMASVRSLEMLLFEVKATDPGILALPTLTILAAACLAAIPAVIRAIRIDPVSMLRAD